MIGTVIAGRYELLSLVSVGGMGTVYRAKEIAAGREVALKLLNPAALEVEPGARRRLMREAQAVMELRHPHIVEVLDAGDEPDGNVYLVMELLTGVDLGIALAERRMRPVEILDAGIQLLDALAAVHARGFVHRDVKPGNIFLADAPRGGKVVKLLDFGIVKRPGHGSMTQLTMGDSLIGTVEFMSPEHAAGDEVDARADLWGVGATLYRGLSGRPPHQAKTEFGLLCAVLKERAPPLATHRADIPSDLAAVVDRALTPARAERWQTAEEMRNALIACDRARVAALAPPRTSEPAIPDDDASDAPTTRMKRG